MTSFIHVEPAHEQRPAFAAWGLAQSRPLQTASATGWDIPLDLYPLIPVELLAGSYVDGYPYDHAQAQPELTPPVKQKEPAAAAERPLLPKRTRKKAASRQPLAAERASQPDVSVIAAVASGLEGGQDG